MPRAEELVRFVLLTLRRLPLGDEGRHGQRPGADQLFGGEAAVIAAIEPAFQGGSIGEVSGAKIAAALELAVREFEAGRKIRPVILFETGGVRLQEANLGLAVIAEIQAAIVALRRYVPVVGVIGGMVGCFGGMSLAAALCSRLVMTRQARLGMARSNRGARSAWPSPP